MNGKAWNKLDDFLENPSVETLTSFQKTLLATCMILQLRVGRIALSHRAFDCTPCPISFQVLGHSLCSELIYPEMSKTKMNLAECVSALLKFKVYLEVLEEEESS